MTLVERLKAASDLRERMEGKNAGWLYAQAADRIEALEATLRRIERDPVDEPATWGAAAEWMRAVARAALADKPSATQRN